MRTALTHTQVTRAIERKDGAAIPVFMGKWWGNGLKEKYGEALTRLEAKYPEDICAGWYVEPGFDVSHTANPEYRFGYRDYGQDERHSIGEFAVLLPDWDELDRFLTHFPDPYEPGNFDPVLKAASQADGRYKLGCWWRFFHERFWAIRGMENLMMDYYDNMDGLKQIGQRLVVYYKALADRFHAAGYHGIFTSDDLGHQTGPMMSPAVFNELYVPLYTEVIQYIHAKGMHVWLHSCGDNTLLMDGLIRSGLDVFHPIQKGCMDMARTVDACKGRLSFLAGMDVQYTLVNGTPAQVREEVAFMRQSCAQPGGGLLLAMGNGIMPDTPLENIEAALDAMYA